MEKTKTMNLKYEENNKNESLTFRDLYDSMKEKIDLCEDEVEFNTLMNTEVHIQSNDYSGNIIWSKVNLSLLTGMDEKIFLLVSNIIDTNLPDEHICPNCKVKTRHENIKAGEHRIASKCLECGYM